jgi:Fe-S-cluster containining protein
MRFGPENPCYDCKIQAPISGIVRAPCCWHMWLGLTPKEYTELNFADSPNVRVIGHGADSLNPDISIEVAIDGACPNLNIKTGECSVQDEKPLTCKSLAPKKFHLCVKASGGRFRKWLKE